ncbi:DUF502 domain-containing protein [Pseudotamlana carrageenivorans]|uniref:DUF502 domain-containing protein n=1 Tax=Pseudotamlana carrageenivorans TaxID=2069432 RepID=A0A2I7SDU2_9FLAO|nr:DUF502 domain-containing protein [Tamlana carrageenivorans]AUS04066.1 hypothetical protein C1A40_00565 [Tamlana carrageenivorans]
MKNLVSFIKTTLIGGLFFIIPISLVIFMAGKVIKVLGKVVGPIAKHIEFSFFDGEMTPRILAILLLFLVCFIAGVFAKTKLANRLREWIENNILSNVPGYTLLKGMTETAAGIDTNNLKEVVLVDVEEVWQIGFLMERIDDDINAVFIPGSPNPMAGDVVFVKWDRLKLLDIDVLKVMKIYRKLGVHAHKIIDGKINKAMFDKKE